MKEALRDFPVVLIQGARQCGKTTLAKMVGESDGYAYRSFDDEATRSFAEADPVGFVRDLPERTILDEVQKVPRLFFHNQIDRRQQAHTGAVHPDRIGECPASAPG